MANAKADSFSVTLYPHRSLSRFGLRVVLGAVITSNLVIGIFFWSLHAWPVFGFLGLDVVLVFVAFALNNRSAAQSEQIIFEGDEVFVIHSSRKGEIRRNFNRRWIRIELERDEERELTGRLFIVSHGKKFEIASFLGAEERAALAKRLQAALVRPKI
ncbi:DUF2244 domain-containing protein [Aestuariivirga litoralis]|uniref:DUF2244 domain-containing protein n=1 Tax=Aestuariivirga litoralis TaxID=2650924 RepID=UPI0018C577E7|nr:DUF2244 domain-containing protein [Aestuariivirga litoralis]